MGERDVLVPPQRLVRWLERWAERHGGAVSTEVVATEMRVVGADGAVLRCEPPFPPLASLGRHDGLATQQLLDHVERDRCVGVLLVRLGGHAAGVFDGRRLVDSKVGRRQVHGRHRAGGQSERRFARRREEEARRALMGAADVAARVLLPAVVRLDAVVLGGDRSALKTVLDDRRLEPLVPLVVERVLDVPDPRLAVLRDTPDAFLATRLREH